MRAGAIVQATDALARSEGADAVAGEMDAPVRALFSELGLLVALEDGLVDVAMGLMSCAPAYVALVAEAQVDAGKRIRDSLQRLGALIALGHQMGESVGKSHLFRTRRQRTNIVGDFDGGDWPLLR